MKIDNMFSVNIGNNSCKDIMEKYKTNLYKKLMFSLNAQK